MCRIFHSVISSIFLKLNFVSQTHPSSVKLMFYVKKKFLIISQTIWIETKTIYRDTKADKYLILFIPSTIDEFIIQDSESNIMD